MFGVASAKSAVIAPVVEPAFAVTVIDKSADPATRRLTWLAAAVEKLADDKPAAALRINATAVAAAVIVIVPRATTPKTNPCIVWIKAVAAAFVPLTVSSDFTVFDNVRNLGTPILSDCNV